MQKLLMKKALRFFSNDATWIAIMSTVVFFICAWYAPQRTGIFLVHDEFSQYAIAAYFAGFDWSDVTSNISYYQFGYPIIFILPLFFLFGDNTLLIYQASLVLNALLAASLVPLIYYVLKQWGMKNIIENKLSIPIILFSALQGFVVAYSNLGLGEVLLVFMGLLLTAVMLRMQTKGANHKRVLLFAFLLVYGYSVHMRFLGVLLSGILVFVLMVITKKIDKRYLISFSLMIIIPFVLSTLMQMYLQANLWQATNVTAFGSGLQNDMAGVLPRVAARTSSLYGLFSLIRVMFGHFWYIGFSSFLLVYLSLILLAKDNYVGIKSYIKSKDAVGFDFSVLFITLGFIATFMISALFMGGAGSVTSGRRGDHFIYGRYNVIMFIPVLLYALSSIFFKKQKLNKYTLLIPIGFMLLSWYVIRFYNFAHNRPIMHFNVINFIVFDDFIINSLIACVGFILFFICLYEKKERILFVLTITSFIFFNILSGYRFITNDVVPFSSHLEINSLTEIKQLDVNDAYLLVGTARFSFERIIMPSTVQIALPSIRIRCISTINELVDDEKLLLIPTRYILEPLYYGFDFEIEKIVNNTLIVVSELNWTDTVETDIPIAIFSSKNGDYTNGSIISNGNADFLLFGPYLNVTPGSYLFTAHLELLDNDSTPNNIGRANITYDGGISIFSEETFSKDDFINGKYTLQIPFSVERDLRYLEFRIFTESNVFLKVSDISVQIITEEK